MDTVIFGIHKGVLIQISPIEEKFFMAEYRYSEPLSYIDAEIEAINVITDIREAHRDMGIEKSPEVYDYMKFKVMEKLEKGIRATDFHKFKHKGEEIKICLN